MVVGGGGDDPSPVTLGVDTLVGSCAPSVTRLRWGGDRPASQLAVSGRSSPGGERPTGAERSVTDRGPDFFSPPEGRLVALYGRHVAKPHRSGAEWGSATPRISGGWVEIQIVRARVDPRCLETPVEAVLTVASGTLVRARYRDARSERGKSFRSQSERGKSFRSHASSTERDSREHHDEHA